MKEIAAGGVVFRRRNEGMEIQLIRDRFGKITLAKGRMENGESVEQTALREIEEETGISGRIVEPVAVIRYGYDSADRGKIDKEVHYFLVEAAEGELKAQVEEIASVSWHEPKRAWHLQQESGYENNTDVLARALSLLGIGDLTKP